MIMGLEITFQKVQKAQGTGFVDEILNNPKSKEALGLGKLTRMAQASEWLYTGPAETLHAPGIEYKQLSFMFSTKFYLILSQLNIYQIDVCPRTSSHTED